MSISNLSKSIKLRMRPSVIRFFILCVAEDDIYVATTYRGLINHINRADTTTLYVADLKNNKVFQADPVKFANWWIDNYEEQKKLYRE